MQLKILGGCGASPGASQACSGYLVEHHGTPLATNTGSVAGGLQRSGRITTAACAAAGGRDRRVQHRSDRVHQTDRHKNGDRDRDRRRAGPVLLVPATMRLAGRANWWSPRWLARRSA
jgi:hypothetical protein